MSLAGRGDLVPSAAGLHVTARVARDAAVDVDEVVRRARRAGVLLRTLSAFYAEGPAVPGLVIGYGAIPTAKVSEGLRRLVASVRASV